MNSPKQIERMALKKCPECQTPQREDAPFCENCGYRLANHKTAVEGLPAITQAMLQGGLGKSRAQTQEEFAVEDVTPAGLYANERHKTEPEHLHPVRLEENTDVEGLPAASPAPSHASASSSNLMTIPPGLSATPAPLGSKKPFVMIAIAAGVGVFLGALVTTFFASEAPATQVSVGQARAQTKIAIAQSSFTQGLNEQTRSLILQACYKVADDPDEQCNQDKMLAGEFPDKQVSVEPFQIDANEVIQSKYSECVDAGKCSAIDTKKCRVYTIQGYQLALRVPKAMLKPNLPTICVTHSQAQAYCTWAKGSLPTHAQWERTARGKEDKPLFPWGDVWDPQIANWGERDILKTAIAGQADGSPWTSPPGAYPKSDSPEGARDMAGNVSEWVQDEGDTAAVRGGNWTSDPFGLRVTVRKQIPKTQARTDVGFRCAYAP